jgi:hypothetical protein
MAWAEMLERSANPNPVPESVMKILLQHTRTQLYVRSLGNWSANPHEAYDFQHSQRAIEFAREHGLTAVQIAIKFIESEFDEVFPLPTVKSPAPSVRSAA